jgi:GNAT superfamily N-acetyltransferase
MTDICITSCSVEDVTPINAALDEFNESHAPFTHSHSYIHFKATVGDQFVGGIIAELNRWGTIMIKVLVVMPSYRGQGYGSQLLNRVHQFAHENDVYLIYLDTFYPQAKKFYEKHGYTVSGKLENYPKGHVLYSLKYDVKPS